MQENELEWYKEIQQIAIVMFQSSLNLKPPKILPTQLK